MSLSPLYPTLKTNLHVRFSTTFHELLGSLQPQSGIDHRPSGRTQHAFSLRQSETNTGTDLRLVSSIQLPSLRPLVCHQKTRAQCALLSPCFETGDKKHINLDKPSTTSLGACGKSKTPSITCAIGNEILLSGAPTAQLS